MRKLRVLIVLLLLPLQGLVPARAQPVTPRLVVVLVVDQMRADYLTRYGGMLEHGLKRLTTGGAWFRNAAYPYFTTVTCPGHTTIGSGTLPFRHGMIGDSWLNRETGKGMLCNDDPGAGEGSFGALKGDNNSAKWMLVPTLAETMRTAGKTRVASISIKARSAIGLAGHQGDFVTWLDDHGAWATSSAFAKGPIVWFDAYLKANPIDRDAGKVWERTLAADRYQYDDNAPGETGSAGWGATFPHELGTSGSVYVNHWLQSPFADEYLEQMAEAAVENMPLGRDAGRTDFLGVSFSTLDIVGHAYGPRSHEVQDVLVRVDATIGRLLAFLDAKVGSGNYVLALSSDHGVADIPEQIPGAGRVNVRTLSATIETSVKTALGGNGPFVAAMNSGDVYLTPGTYARLKKDPAALHAVIGAVMNVAGVARVLTSDEIATASARESNDPHLRAAALSYFPGRSGDLLVAPKENWIFTGNGTTHGSWYDYDQRVPMILYGAGIRAGEQADATTPADIAPTLASVLGIRLQSPDGHVLKTALAR